MLDILPLPYVILTNKNVGLRKRWCSKMSGSIILWDEENFSDSVIWGFPLKNIKDLENSSKNITNLYLLPERYETKQYFTQICNNDWISLSLYHY